MYKISNPPPSGKEYSQTNFFEKKDHKGKKRGENAFFSLIGKKYAYFSIIILNLTKLPNIRSGLSLKVAKKADNFHLRRTPLHIKLSCGKNVTHGPRGRERRG